MPQARPEASISVGLVSAGIEQTVKMEAGTRPVFFF